MLFLAGPATAACHVERHRYHVALFEGFDIFADFQHFTRDFMAQHQSGRRRGAAAHHVLIRSADIGRYHLQDHSMFDLAALRVFQFRKGDRLHFYFALRHINDAAIFCHCMPPAVELSVCETSRSLLFAADGIYAELLMACMPARDAQEKGRALYGYTERRGAPSRHPSQAYRI